LDGKTDDLALLEDAKSSTLSDVEVVVKNDLKGLAHSDVKPGCVNIGVIV